MTNLEKTARATIKQRSTLVEKERMKTWKQIIMQEVVWEIKAIWKSYEKALKTQKHNFQIEFEKVNGRLELVKARSATLINEKMVLKSLKTASI